MTAHRTIEQVRIDVPDVGRVIALRQQTARHWVWREASASRLGVFELNRNHGATEWSRVPVAALRGERPRFHQRSALRRAAPAAYAAIAEVA